MLREIDKVLLAEMEERMQDEVDGVLQREVYPEPWYGFTSENSVSALIQIHPETYYSFSITEMWLVVE
jgi:hypothetical protein